MQQTEAHERESLKRAYVPLDLDTQEGVDRVRLKVRSRAMRRTALWIAPLALTVAGVAILTEGREKADELTRLPAQAMPGSDMGTAAPATSDAPTTTDNADPGIEETESTERTEQAATLPSVVSVSAEASALGTEVVVIEFDDAIPAIVGQWSEDLRVEAGDSIVYGTQWPSDEFTLCGQTTYRTGDERWIDIFVAPGIFSLEQSVADGGVVDIETGRYFESLGKIVLCPDRGGPLHIAIFNPASVESSDISVVGQGKYLTVSLRT